MRSIGDRGAVLPVRPVAPARRTGSEDDSPRKRPDNDDHPVDRKRDDRDGRGRPSTGGVDEMA